MGEGVSERLRQAEADAIRAEWAFGRAVAAVKDAQVRAEEAGRLLDAARDEVSRIMDTIDKGGEL